MRSPSHGYVGPLAADQASPAGHWAAWADAPLVLLPRSSRPDRARAGAPDPSVRFTMCTVSTESGKARKSDGIQRHLRGLCVCATFTANSNDASIVAFSFVELNGCASGHRARRCSRPHKPGALTASSRKFSWHDLGTYCCNACLLVVSVPTTRYPGQSASLPRESRLVCDRTRMQQTKNQGFWAIWGHAAAQHVLVWSTSIGEGFREPPDTSAGNYATDKISHNRSQQGHAHVREKHRARLQRS